MSGWFSNWNNKGVWYTVPHIRDKQHREVAIQLIEKKIPSGTTIGEGKLPYTDYYTYYAVNPSEDVPTPYKIEKGMTVHFIWRYVSDPNTTYTGTLKFIDTGYWNASLDGSPQFDVDVTGHPTLLNIMHMVFYRYFYPNLNPNAGVPELTAATDGGSSRRKKTNKRRKKRTIKRRKTKRK